MQWKCHQQIFQVVIFSFVFLHLMLCAELLPLAPHSTVSLARITGGTWSHHRPTDGDSLVSLDGGRTPCC